MKKFLSIAAILMMAYTTSDAQILWKISGHGLKSPSYVLGTHHIAPLSVLDDIKGFENAFLAVDQVCGELVMAEMQEPATMMEMQKAMILPEGKTLQDYFTPEEYDRIALSFKRLTGVELKMMNQVKPVVVMQQMVLVMSMIHLDNYNANEQIDSHLQVKATEAGKKVSALETLDQQIDLLFNTPLEDQAKELIYLVDHEEESMQDAKELAEAYQAQDLDAVLKSMEEENEESGKEEEDLEKMLYGRNENWLGQMPQIMKEGPVMFVVGAGHLPGERGILQGLRDQGYRVRPVK